MVWAWFSAAVVFLMVELHSPGLFYFLSFASGAALAAGTSLFSESLILQCAVFIGGTVVSLLLLKYLLAHKKVHVHSHRQTNVYALIGKRGLLVRAITHVPGQVKVNGEVWQARAINAELHIPSESTVEVVNVIGSTLIVKQVS